MLKSILLVVLLFLVNISHSQLSTYAAYSPFFLDQELLFGPDISVSNINYTGSNYAIGYFNFVNKADIGIKQGIMLTTGQAFNNNNGPLGPNNQVNAGFDNKIAGYSQINILANTSASYNASILEFDLIPNVDTLSIKYVFGSDEFPEFVGKGFNDIFVIFLSSNLGIENIALFPNNFTTAIDSIPNNSVVINSNNFIQYDAYTIVNSIKKIVTPGVVYHLKFVIADCGDAIFDSGVFIETFQQNVGIEENKKIDSKFKIFPNPISENTKIEFELTENNIVSLSVINSEGKIISNDNFGYLIEGKHTFVIETTHLSKGTYIVNLKFGDSIITQKLIIK